MIGSIVGVVGLAMGGVASAGAAAAVWRGGVRGVGRLIEGDPVGALREVCGGVMEPVVIAGTQVMNLAHDVANVTVYAGANVAGLLSPQARALVEKIGGFDNTVAAIVLSASLPKLPGGPPAEPATVPAAPAGRDTRAAVAV